VGDAFSSFTSNPNMLPVDTHEIVGMVAPRGLFIMENPTIDWLAARSGSVAALGGAEIYKALGAGQNISYWSDVQNGTHCAVRPEWQAPLQQSIKAFLENTGTPPGVFRISSLKQGNLSQWRSWTTPTLTSTPPTTPPPTTPPPTTPPPTSPPPTGGCSASVSLNKWTGGFVATVTVTAGSSPVNGWTVSMTLPAGATIVSTWSASASGTSGTVQFANVSYDGSIGAGQSTQFGHQGTGTATGLTPTCTAT
jgi:hypothetical protein